MYIFIVAALQQSGEGADPNKYYIGFKAYAPEDSVGFKEALAKTISSDVTLDSFDDNDFAGTDSQGRKYSVVWLPVAKYDPDTEAWTYYGTNSSTDKYIGWYYSVEWYDSDNEIIASDCIRINLANEDCYSLIEPYYVKDTLANANAYTDQQISQITNGYEVVEF